MEESIVEGKARFKSRLDKLKRTKTESKTVHGKLIYRRTLQKFTEGVVSLQNKASGVYVADWDYLKDLKPLLIAHLTLITLLDTLSVRQKRVSIAVKIGQKIFDEINFGFLKRNHPKWWKGVSKNVGKRISYGYKRNYAVRAAIAEFGSGWMAHSSDTAKTHVGLSLVELFRQTTGLIEYSKSNIGKKRWEYVVLPTPEAFDWIERVNKKAENLSPFFLPTEEIPEDWKSLDVGGYRFPPEIRWKFFKGHQRYDKTDNFSLLYSAANTLQRVPFRVNESLYKVAVVEYRNKVNEIEQQSVNNKKALKETDYTLVYRQCQAKYHASRLKELPERIRVDNTLSLAKRFTDTAFYLPVQADFRGRLYYAPRYLNPQGSDLSRGVLQFATPTGVKGCEHWFLIGGANAFGVRGKLTDRQEWVLSHEREIKQVAADPLTFRWWKDATSPYQFLAFCFEFSQWMADRIRFKTRLPVRLDHHASGLQIIACLNKDSKLMRLTNVADCKEPNDVYEEILKELLLQLKKSRRPESFHWASMIDRKLVKSMTLKLMYGGTYYGLERTVVSWYVQLPEDVFQRNLYKEIRNLIDSYSFALNNVSPTPLRFLRETQMKQRSEAVSFESPSGFTVINNYKKYRSQRVKTTVNNEVIVSRLSLEEEGLNLRAARTALAANLVHMYDAAVMHHVLNSRHWDNIQTMHDCYAIPPMDCDNCMDAVKDAMGAVLGVDMPATMWYAAS